MTTNKKAILGTGMFEILRDKVASRQGSLQDMLDAAATLAATVVNEATRITEAPLNAVLGLAGHLLYHCLNYQRRGAEAQRLWRY